MKTWRVALPYIGPFENFVGFAEKVEPECWRHFVITDNSKNSDLKALKLEERSAAVTYCPHNDGVARSWNRGIGAGYELTILVSCSMRFPEGFKSVAESMARVANDYGSYTHHGWHCIGIGWRSVQEVGLIDENFWPAYCEDLDYIRRWMLNGTPENSLPRCNPSLVSTGDAVALKAGLIKWTGDLCHAYFKRKWGSDDPAKATFTHPFNDPNNSIAFWSNPGKYAPP